MKGLRYSLLHVTEFCGEMQGKFKVGLARLIKRKAKSCKGCIRGCSLEQGFEGTSYPFSD